MRRKILLSIALILIMFIGCVYATEEGAPIPKEWLRTGEISENVEKEKISETYFMVDENASLQDKIIDGNLFAVGTSMFLDNVEVYGNVFIAGQNTTISNITVHGTAFLVSETINISNSNFNGNVFSASQTINFEGVAQDLFVASENLAVNNGSIIHRDVFAAGSSVVFSGNVGRNVNMSGNEIMIMDGTIIDGALNYSSVQEAGIAVESQIGSINFNKQEEIVENEGATRMSHSVYNAVVLLIKSIFVCGFIFLYARGFIEKQKTENVVGYFVKNTFKGLGWLILIPTIAILLLFTGVSVGLSFVVLALYSMILWLSVPVVAIAITANVTKNQEFKAWKFYGYSLLISIILILVKQVSTLGGIMTFVFGLATLGIVMSSLKNKKVKNSIDNEVIK